MAEPLLSIRNLKVEFSTRQGRVTALDGIGLDLMPGETLGIVGESGCGKSITALATMGLIPDPPGRITGGGSCSTARTSPRPIRGGCEACAAPTSR